MKKGFLFVMALLAAVFSASAQTDGATVRWKIEVNKIEGRIYEVAATGRITTDWHIYGISNEYNPTQIVLNESKDYEILGETYEISKTHVLDGDDVFEGTAKLGRKIKVVAEAGVTLAVSGQMTWQACTNGMCYSPEEWDFTSELTVPAEQPADVKKEEPAPAGKTAIPAEETAVAERSSIDNGEKEVVDLQETATVENAGADDIDISNAETENISQEAQSSDNTWALIVEAIMWGLAMMLTPCVFPMIPMTISFFMKDSSSPAAGRFKAFMYGLFIVLLYTLPISIIILLTRILGGDAVTADIFNWLATHWLPNLIFFAVFMVFAASFFGAFEITLPSALVNKSDQNSDKKGLAGIFFMALTLVLVSFSCTGPIVGTVLIKATQGQSFWTPMVTMLAFSVAFALPFTIFAMFPSLLKKLKSGSWLNSVKVVLGFIEVALGFKFLSVADQTYHWGILDREVYLAIWIVVFTLLGLYLLGKIRFESDSPVEHLSVPRLSLVILVFSFVVYLVPGMFGAPLKALSGYLPPIETQDFVVWQHSDGANIATTSADNGSTASVSENKFGLKLPHGLQGYFSIEEGLEAARKAGKPVFVDITGHGCVNCREMEARVWSDPRVLNILRNDYVIVALYTDDKTKLDEQDWVTTENGKILKDLGKVNSYIVRTRFNVNAQPNYALLDTDGKLMVPVRGYNLDVDKFIEFLQSGLEKFNK